MNRPILRLLDILIIIAFFGLLYILIQPQYKQTKIATKEKELHSNMFTVKAAIERYRAFNNGEIPYSLEDIYNNVEALEVPENPYTKSKMTVYDLGKFLYDVPSQTESVDTNGYHGDIRGNPGEIRVGYYVTTPEKDDTVARKYALISFNEKGKPLTVKEGEKVRIIVLE